MKLVKSPYNIETTMALVRYEEDRGNLSHEELKAFFLSEENVIPECILDKIKEKEIKQMLGD